VNTNQFLPFALPDIGEDEINEVVDSLRSGWVTTGAKTKKFEELFSAYIGENVESIAVNSATAGLHLALEAIGVGPDDEVIIPSYTFTATGEIVRYLNAKPVIVDVCEKTFNIDPNAIEKAITPKTKAIIPVHFAGLSCDMDAILNIAKKYKLKVIEDAAHSLPTTYKGKMIGTLESDVTVFSFYANKTMTTGEGGMVVTKNKEIAARCKIMRLHGINRDAFDRYTSKTPAWYYEVVAAGFKYNLTDIASSIGIHQLKRLHGFQIAREEMAQYYNKSFKDLPLVLPANAPAGDTHARHLYPVRILPHEKINRSEFIQKMADAGIGCSVHFIPLHNHPYWRNFCGINENMFPIAQKLYEQEVTLPLYTKMSMADCARVVDTVRSILNNV
jgi:dTDP-4-amino-4,6-dideoxygalactose transaminase